MVRQKSRTTIRQEKIKKVRRVALEEKNWKKINEKCRCQKQQKQKKAYKIEALKQESGNNKQIAQIVFKIKKDRLKTR